MALCSSVLVTGANRSIGLEFVKQLVQLSTPPKYVFATYRSKDTAQVLDQIRNTSAECKVITIQADMTKQEDVASLRHIIQELVGESGLNLLLNNAGVLQLAGFGDLTPENMMQHFHTNTVGPAILTQELLPLLQKAANSKDSGMSVSRAAVVNISSYSGSISDALDLPRITLSAMSYRTSKAALNMVMRMISMELVEHGVLVVNMCPGWVRTAMGSEDAPLHASESVTAMLKTFTSLSESHHGTFVDRNGEPIAF